MKKSIIQTFLVVLFIFIDFALLSLIEATWDIREKPFPAWYWCATFSSVLVIEFTILFRKL